jgi:hypothetical protein
MLACVDFAGPVDALPREAGAQGRNAALPARKQMRVGLANLSAEIFVLESEEADSPTASIRRSARLERAHFGTSTNTSVARSCSASKPRKPCPHHVPSLVNQRPVGSARLNSIAAPPG